MHTDPLQGMTQERWNAMLPRERDAVRDNSRLTAQLIGLEGRRVEIVDMHGDKRRFYVGKSTGWRPCHLEIARVNSSGGGPVYGAPFKSVRVLNKRRY